MTTNQPPSRETRWRTSSYSGTAGNCLQITQSSPGICAIRNSKDPSGLVLMCTLRDWFAFTAWVCADELDSSYR
jgi:hypothetical protein